MTTLGDGVQRARQAGEILRQVADVVFREVRGHALHDGVVAPAVLVLVQGLDDVILVLAREDGELVGGAEAVSAVAGGTSLGLVLAGGGIAVGEGGL